MRTALRLALSLVCFSACAPLTSACYTTVSDCGGNDLQAYGDRTLNECKWLSDENENCAGFTFAYSWFGYMYSLKSASCEAAAGSCGAEAYFYKKTCVASMLEAMTEDSCWDSSGQDCTCTLISLGASCDCSGTVPSELSACTSLTTLSLDIGAMTGCVLRADLFVVTYVITDLSLSHPAPVRVWGLRSGAGTFIRTARTARSYLFCA